MTILDMLREGLVGRRVTEPQWESAGKVIKDVNLGTYDQYDPAVYAVFEDGSEDIVPSEIDTDHFLSRKQTKEETQTT